MLRAGTPPRYWVILAIPPNDLGGLRPARAPGPPRGPMKLVTVSDSLSAGGLFFDVKPLLVIAAGALLFCVLFWLPLVHGITRAISKMTDTTGRIAEGRFEVRVGSRRRDELGTLGGAIDRMAARLAGFVTGQKRFLGDIAHELCAPVARMQLALGILEERADEKQRGYVGDVREELQQMSQLINELLSFSKASLGAAAVRLQPVALRGVAEKAIQRETTDASQALLDIADELTAEADPELLQRALANLIRNAIRYAGSAGPVEITASQSGSDITLVVADSGPGIPAAALARIFDPFYRLDPSRDRETGGVGLGLAIVKTCVESCGGRVSARNREPSGLEILIHLRAANV